MNPRNNRIYIAQICKVYETLGDPGPNGREMVLVSWQCEWPQPYHSNTGPWLLLLYLLLSLLMKKNTVYNSFLCRRNQFLKNVWHTTRGHSKYHQWLDHSQPYMWISDLISLIWFFYLTKQESGLTSASGTFFFLAFRELNLTIMQIWVSLSFGRGRCGGFLMRLRCETMIWCSAERWSTSGSLTGSYSCSTFQTEGGFCATLGPHTFPYSSNLPHLQPGLSGWFRGTAAEISGYQFGDYRSYKTAVLGVVQASAGTNLDHHQLLCWLCSSETISPTTTVFDT